MLVPPPTPAPTAASTLPIRSAASAGSTASTAAAVSPATAVPTTLGQQMRDRRRGQSPGRVLGRERRQFASSHDDLSDQGREFAQAIDAYKLQNRRRFVNADELLMVLRSLGYGKKELGGTIDRRA